ncbi:5'-3' exoribonuclease 2 [Glycine soja]|uniref:5'-3' exoribonuclease 2 n=1 Tax=Glycine soja TaxID=3848 RepID=A0A0B2QF56_GLYSO|nr:5'-3' exoribonuclease 2 [Glycine soja]
MGVPSFYRWLVNKYPKVVQDVVDPTMQEDPNGVKFGNLYLDMNAIIHPCFHPEDDDNIPFPTTFQDVFRNVFDYIDRLVETVRPSKLLYMAIAEEERLRRQFGMKRKQVLPKQQSDVSDSNIITPGTEFMHELSKALKSYISSRITSNSLWKDIMVILSDANVSGEGEHKIMSYIRKQLSLEGYNPNTSHCLYGSDVDLIMLAMATHEPHFSILREGAIDLLMTVYKKEFNKLGGYLVDMSMSRIGEKNAAFLKLSRLEKFILAVGAYEEKIFKKRSEIREKYLRRFIRDSEDAKQDEENATCYSDLDEENTSDCTLLIKSVLVNNVSATHAEYQIEQNTKDLKDELKICIREKCDLFQSGNFLTDKVQKYTEGLVWVLQYYFSSVASWTWFYPFHYGPFASDLKGMGQVRVKFEKGVPFLPRDQLLSENEAIRNSVKADSLFVRSASELAEKFGSLSLDTNPPCKLETISSDGIGGNISLCDEFIEKPCLDICDNKKEDSVLCVYYELPAGSNHIPRLLSDVKLPEKTIFEIDIMETELWHEPQKYYSRFERVQNQDKWRSENTSNTSRFPPNASNQHARSFVYKDAGVGLGSGRGKRIDAMANESVPNNIRTQHFVDNFRQLRISESNNHFPRPGGGSSQSRPHNIGHINQSRNAPYHQGSQYNNGYMNQPRNAPYHQGSQYNNGYMNQSKNAPNHQGSNYLTVSNVGPGQGRGASSNSSLRPQWSGGNSYQVKDQNLW